jgi:hypothetical protein
MAKKDDIKPSLFFIANLMNFVLATGVFTYILKNNYT